MPGSDRLFVGACLVCAVAPFARLVFSAGSVGPDTIWTDYASQQAPLHEFAREELSAGRFPSWIPWLGCGTPLHASQQAAICYLPVTLPVLLLGADVGLKLSLCLHVAILFAGEFVLARALAASRPAAALAATVTAQSGLVVNHLLSGHVNIVTTVSLSPWCFLFLVRLLERPTLPRCVAFGVTGGLMALACMPQVAYYMAIACGAWAVATLAGGFERRTALRCWLYLAGAALLAVLLGAVQLLPALELISDAAETCDRGGLEFATGYALRPIDLIKLISPNIMGNPFVSDVRFGGFDHFHERVVYLGLAVPLLGALGLSRATAARWQYGAALICGVALVIAFGDETPAFETLGLALPGLFMFRCPGRVFCVVSVLAPLIAARGLDAWINGQPKASGERLLMLAACALSLIALLIDPLVNALTRFEWFDYLEFARSHLTRELSCGLLLAATTTTTLLAARKVGRKRPRMAYVAVLASTILDVGYHNSWHVRTWPASRLPARPEALAVGHPRRFVDAPEYPAFPAYTFAYTRMVPAAGWRRSSALWTMEHSPSTNRSSSSCRRRASPIKPYHARRHTQTRSGGSLLFLFRMQDRLLDDFFLHVAGHDLVAVELHRKAALPAGHAR